MNTNIKEQNKEKVVISVELNKEEWNEEIKKAYLQEKGHFKVEGFRPGKAPQKVIETQYGASVFYETALQNVLDSAFVNFLTEHKEIKPLFDHPHCDIQKVDADGIKATMQIELTPEVKLGQYKGLEVKKAVIEVKDEDVQRELEQIATGFAETVDKEAEAQVENGDIAVIDFSGTINGEAFEGGSDEDYELKIGSHSFIDTFEEQLIGLKRGDTKDVKVKFPENYGASNLAGKDAVFYCTIKDIKVQKLPEFNDEFAKKVGPFENFNALKGYVKSQLEQRATHEMQHQNESNILDKIVEASEVELSDVFVEHQLDAVMHDMEYRLMYQGLTLDQYCEYVKKTKEQIREEKREDAKRIGKTRLVMEKIIEVENLKVEDEEIDKKVQELALQAKKSVAEFTKTLPQNQIDYIINEIIVNKFYDLLMKENKLI